MENSDFDLELEETFHHNEPVGCEVGTDCESDGNEEDDRTSDVDEYNFDELELIKKQKIIEIDDKLNHYKEIDIGMTFKDLTEARKFMNLYAVANAKALKMAKSDKTRLRYKCEKPCPFSCLISRDGKGPGFKVKTLKSKHTCNEAFFNPRATTSTLAEYFKKRVQDDPKYKVKDMQVDLKKEFTLNACETKLKRAKRMVLQKMHGSFLKEFNSLEAYAQEIRESNPGSDVVINISKDALVEGKRKFLRMYICFNALKMGWKNGLRPFIGLDGTFLRGQCKGQVLVAMGQDCMNHFYPLAWAVVDKETTRTWLWFLGLLKNSLELDNGYGVTFMSDMQKGLLDAVNTILPDANHRWCVRHIEANWCKRWRSGEMRKLMWWAAWSTYEEDFNDQLHKLGSLDEKAPKDLVNYPPQRWSRAFLDTVCKNQMVDNNFTESFNKWILEARKKPILKMLEEIRKKTMKRIAQNELESLKWDDDYSPQCMRLFQDNMKIAHHCTVDFNGANGYEVTDGSDQHTVNLSEKKCTCRGWDLSGIPCPHAIRAMQHKKVNPTNEIDWWYSKAAYMQTYEHKMMPVRGEKFWKILPEHAMEPPDLVSTAGRPRIKRVREKHEAILRQAAWVASRRKSIMSCSKCGSTDHNVRRCNLAAQGMKRNRVNNEGQFSDDFNSSAPPPSQPGAETEFVFMPTPGFQRENDMAYGPLNDSDSDPDIRPRVISEEETLFEKRQSRPRIFGKRVINFTGDHQGVCQPRNMLYSPSKLRWNGKGAVTGNQLEVQRQEKISKLKARKGSGVSQL